MKKRGISPVVATVLLVAMVVVIGVIIFLWFRSFTQEAITKGGTNVELVCADVIFDASYSSGILYITNSGNVPIYGMKLKVSGDKSFDTIDLEDFEGLGQGEAFSDSVNIGTSDSITLVPVLLGESDEGQRTFVCDEGQYGYEIFV